MQQQYSQENGKFEQFPTKSTDHKLLNYLDVALERKRGRKAEQALSSYPTYPPQQSSISLRILPDLHLHLLLNHLTTHSILRTMHLLVLNNTILIPIITIHDSQPTTLDPISPPLLSSPLKPKTKNPPKQARHSPIKMPHSNRNRSSIPHQPLIPIIRPSKELWQADSSDCTLRPSFARDDGGGEVVERGV